MAGRNNKSSNFDKYRITLPTLIVLLVIGGVVGWYVAQQIQFHRQIRKAQASLNQLSVLLSEKNFSPIVAVADKLAAHPQLIATATGHATSDDPTTLSILSDAKYLLDASLVYLLNAKGDTVACTPYARGQKTLTGKNYSFRPYFVQPIKTGASSSYVALGTTTGKRGLYFSSPIRQKRKIVGVVVIKISLRFIDQALRENTFPCALIDSNGIIFASNQPEWLFKAAHGLTAERKKALLNSRQYANMPLENLSVNLSLKRLRYKGRTYLPVISEPDGHGFTFVLLSPLRAPSPLLVLLSISFSLLIITVLFSVALVLQDRSELLRNLRNSEKNYFSIINNLQSAFFRLGPDGRFILVSPILYKLYQPQRENNLLNKPFTAIMVIPEQMNDFRKILAENNGKVRNYECQLKRKDGTIAQTLINASYYYDEKNNEQGIEGVIYDITDKFTLQKRLALLNTAIEATANAIIITDPQGVIIWANQAFMELSGYAENEVIGQSTTILKSGKQDDAFYQKMWETITQGHEWHGEFINKRKNGELYYEEMLITPVKNDDGEIMNFIAIKGDISARIHEKEEREELLRKERDAKQQIAKEKYKAEQASIAKTDFLTNMRHEIRTPMNGIMGMTDLVLQTNLTAKQRKLLLTVADSSKKLLQILNNILDFSKIEDGQLGLVQTNFHLGQTLKPVLDSCTVLAKEKNLTFNSEVEELNFLLIGDPVRFSQIVRILCDNAIKYTEEGHVDVRISCIKPDAVADKCLVHCVVRDTGIGIDSQAHENIFEGFHQVDNSISRKYNGLGLDLALGRRLLSLMGGDFHLESTPGHGSTFSFTLEFPLAHEDNDAPLSQTDNKAFSCLAGAKILLVEDNSFNQMLATELLKQQKCHISIAGNGQEALELLDKNSFDIILMDIQMPAMDGLTATEKIRQSKNIGFHNIPIIAMTANDMENDRQTALDIGMNGYVNKPLEPKVLFPEIIKWLSPGQHASLNADKISSHTKKTNQQPALLDREGGLMRVMNNKNTYNRLLKNFEEVFQDIDKQIMVDIRNNDITSLKMKVHTLKGAAGGIGGMKLQAACAELEAAISHKKEHQLITDDVEDILFSLDDLLNEIKETANNQDDAQPLKSDGTTEILQRLYQQFGASLKIGKFRECQKLTEELEKYSWNKEEFNDLEQLMILLKKYNFTKAFKLLEKYS